MSRSIVLCLLLVLCGCVEYPLDGDTVRDEDQAIGIAKIACRKPPSVDSTMRWHAVLRGGEWYTWWGTLKEPQSSIFYTWVRARDGYVWSDTGTYVPAAQGGCTFVA